MPIELGGIGFIIRLAAVLAALLLTANTAASEFGIPEDVAVEDFFADGTLAIDQSGRVHFRRPSPEPLPLELSRLTSPPDRVRSVSDGGAR